ANGVAIDASDFAEGDAEAGGPEFSRKPAAEIFPPVRQTINLDALARREGEISLAEAEARIAAWREAAAEVGRTGANRDKVIVSLFDYTGAWSQPWEDAGYRVLRFDIKTGSDLLTSDWFWNRLSEIREQGIEVYGVLS